MALTKVNRGMSPGIDQAKDEVIDGSPTSLDTLEEISNAIDNDPNFSTTLSNNYVKQTSPTDNTSGRLLLTSAFGLGESIDSLEVDLNNYTTGGFYLTPTSGLLNLPSNAPTTGRYHVLVLARSYVTQIIIPAFSGSAQIWVRRRDGVNPFEDWTELWNNNSDVTAIRDKLNIYTEDEVNTLLSAKANLDSPVFTGNPEINGRLDIETSSYAIGLKDPDGTDSFALYTNADNLFILSDRDSDGIHEAPNPLHLRNNFEDGLLYNQRIYTEGNILGAVAQSGGIPTGAVIERGSNSNGEYIKFADGTMICTMRKTINFAIVNPYGSLFQDTYVWTFPASFTTNPVANCSEFKWRTGASWGTISAVSNVIAILRVIDTDSRAIDTTEVAASAIGRWF